jgi:hypothetical protein
MNLDSSKDLIFRAMVGDGQAAARDFAREMSLTWGLHAAEARAKGQDAAFYEQQADEMWAQSRTCQK